MEAVSLFDNWASSGGEAAVAAIAPLPTTRKIVIFDIETQKTFQDVGGRQHLHKLMVSAAVAYSSASDSYQHFTERNVFQLVSLLQSLLPQGFAAP